MGWFSDDSEDEDEVTVHEVVRGDTLYKIAKHYYGDGDYYMAIFEANEFLEDPDEIEVGMHLVIPELVDEDEEGC